MALIKTLVLAVTLVLSSRPLSAVTDSAGSALLVSPDAGAIALAEAVSSFGSDEEGITTIHYNPAAAAYLKNPELSLMGRKGIADDNFASMFLGFPTQRGSFSGSFLYYAVGDVDLIDTLGRSRTVTAQRDFAVSVSYAETFFDNIGTGLSLKFLNSKLIDTFSASAVALDLGIQTRLEDDRLAMGLSVLNLGSDLTYIESSEPLPLTFRIGVSYRLHFKERGRVIVAVDAVKEREDDVKQFIGLDYLWGNVLALRTGYKIGQDLGTFSIGAGFTIGRFEINYALTDAGDVGKIHTVSTAIKFGYIDTDGDINY